MREFQAIEVPTAAAFNALMDEKQRGGWIVAAFGLHLNSDSPFKAILIRDIPMERPN